MLTGQVCWEQRDSRPIILFYNTWAPSLPNEMALYGWYSPLCDR